MSASSPEQIQIKELVLKNNISNNIYLYLMYLIYWIHESRSKYLDTIRHACTSQYNIFPSISISLYFLLLLS